MISYDDFVKIQNSLLPDLNVSRETFERLCVYIHRLFEYNQNFNLIGSQEKDNIWERHVFDSMQIYPYVEKNKKICDIGSGAGFPGLVLGILGISNMTLVESNSKKVKFLEDVSRETLINNRIICKRVENLKGSFDVVMARALAPLEKLLTWSQDIFYDKTKFIFPKGKKYQEEIDEAHKKFVFDVRSYHSVTSEDGRILVIENVQRNENNRCR